MRLWPKEAFCVDYLETFEAMPLRFKLLDLSEFLAAPLMTLAAYFRWFGGRELWSKDLWIWYAVFFWIMDLFALSNFVRGIRARSRGVVAETGNQLDPGRAKRSLIITGFVTCALALLVVFPNGGHPHFGASDQWVLPIAFLGVFFSQLSTYARARFWKSLSTGTASPAISA